jgi:hypothetical protein
MLYAKRARGMMARYVIQHRITDAKSLQGFDSDNYHYNPQLSSPDSPVFTRGD